MGEDRNSVTVDAVLSGNKSDFSELTHLAALVGDGRLLKMEVDYASQVDAALPKADALAKKGDVAGAVESLTTLEKQSRLGCDMKSNTRIVQHMVKLCFEGKKYELLNETIVSLSKKRLLIKVAIARMVRDCCVMVEKMPDEELRMKLIDTLRTVTNGKIYVEVERARLTAYVVKKLELEGKIDDAANMLLELQVETYGSMEIKERVEFLLEQMRLSIARNDFVRAHLISKKISTRFFTKDPKNEAIQDLKLKYYELMIKIGLNENAYLNVCRYYRAVQETPKVSNDIDKTKHALKCAVIYALLAPHDNEQWDLVHRLVQSREIATVDEYKKLLELFINQEIISWRESFKNHYEAILRTGTQTDKATGIFQSDEAGNKRWKDLHTRVGEHNMRMIAKYYTRISFERLAELIDLPVDETETFLCNLIVAGQIPNAKIHRPCRIVDLRGKKAAVEHLDQWASNVRKLTDTLNKVSHLILKEEMVHANLDQVAVHQ